MIDGLRKVSGALEIDEQRKSGKQCYDLSLNHDNDCEICPLVEPPQQASSH